MKKILALILALSMTLSLAACGGSKDTPAAGSEKQQEAAQSSEAQSSAEDAIIDEGWDELEALGQIQTENGVLTVSITMPADLIDEEVTQEELDAEAGEEYISAKLNEDGSVTYKLTKQQHKDMLDEMVEGFESALQEMVDDEEFSFTEIKHNNDFTQFDVTVSGEELSFSDSFATFALYMFSGMYGVFSGHTDENIVVNYYSASGNLIETANSADLGA